MSTVSSLNNQNRVYTKSVQTPAADGTSTVLYASVGNFPNAATIKSVKVSLSSGTLTNPTVTILNNGAAHKAAPTAVFPVNDVHVATTTALPSTAAIIYNNGASGVGATLTRGENGALGTIDGVTLLVSNRILVKNQPNAQHNGIYLVSAVGGGGAPYVLTRVADADQTSTEVRYGLATTVTSGTVNGGKKFFMSNSAAITMGATVLPFTEYTSLTDGFVEGSGVGTASGQTATVTFTAPGVNWQDNLRSGCLNLAVSMAGAIPINGKFTIDVEYVPLQNFSIASADSTGVKADASWQILRLEEGSTVAKNITSLLTQNFNPYGLGGDSNSLSVLVWEFDTELLYIGSKEKFGKILIHPHTSSADGFKDPTIEYWNGTVWSPLSQVFDNTSDQQATRSSMSYAGAMSFSPPGDWAPTKLAEDPMTTYENGILAGTEYPPGMMVHPSRYYIRILANTPNGVTPTRLVKVLPLV